MQQKILRLGEAAAPAEVAPSELISHSDDATIPTEDAVVEKIILVDDAATW